MSEIHRPSVLQQPAGEVLMLDISETLSPDYEEITKRVFFNLMQNGWVENRPFRRRNFCGRGKQSSYIKWGDEKGWHGIDEWRTSELLGHHSVGETTIWYKQCFVWYMQYSGWYNPEAIPHLKAALHENYSQGIWHGGRGPEQWSDSSDAFCYINNVERTDFSKFNGTEFIGKMVTDQEQPKVIGLHNYRGGFMFQTPHDQHGH